MNITHGKGTDKYGPGVNIELDANEVATAIDAYLVAHGVHTSGARTVMMNGVTRNIGSVYVDPSGFVITPEFGADFEVLVELVRNQEARLAVLALHRAVGHAPVALLIKESARSPLVREYPAALVAGDFNMASGTGTRRGLDEWAQELGFVQVSSGPTHFVSTESSGTDIDSVQWF